MARPTTRTTGKEGKQVGVPMEAGAFVAAVQGLLGQVQDALLAEAVAFRDAHIVDVSSYEELKAAVAEGE
jgi:prolyl-tRNA synthetase